LKKITALKPAVPVHAIDPVAAPPPDCRQIRRRRRSCRGIIARHRNDIMSI
jgi:hypothetical protein